MGRTRLSSSAPPPDPRLASLNRSRWLAFALGLLGLCVIAVGVTEWVRAIPDRPGPLTESRDIVIAPGGTQDVAEQLRHARVIDNAITFQAVAWWTADQGPLRAAEFRFPAQASLRHTLAILRTARPVEHRVTIPEGLTAARIREILDRVDAASGVTGDVAEGSVLPNTYHFERGLARPVILGRAQAAMTREVAAAWESRAPDLPLTSPRELVILASIVERETARAEERARVAGVFINRLRRGTRLQSDPTVIYTVSGGTGMLDRKLTRADLDRDDPFNTYRFSGLPPHPISAPGVASLRAVANPARTEDLFFVADGDGGHSFARTLDEHNRNVARYRERLGQ